MGKLCKTIFKTFSPTIMDALVAQDLDGRPQTKKAVEQYKAAKGKAGKAKAGKTKAVKAKAVKAKAAKFSSQSGTASKTLPTTFKVRRINHAASNDSSSSSPLPRIIKIPRLVPNKPVATNIELNGTLEENHLDPSSPSPTETTDSIYVTDNAFPIATAEEISLSITGTDSITSVAADELVMSPDMRDVSSKNFDVSVEIDHTISYEIEVRKHRAVMPLDDDFLRMVVPAFNEDKRCLRSNSFLIVKRRCVIENENVFTWLYSCSCNPCEELLIQTVDTFTSLDQTDITSGKCMHVKVVENIVQELRKTADDEFDPFSYTSNIEGKELLEISFDCSKFVVMINESVGIVGFEQNKFRCYQCGYPYCKHVLYAKEVKDSEEVPNFLSDIVSFPSAAVAPAYTYKSVSYKLINFIPSARSQFCLRNAPHAYLETSNDEEVLLECFDSETISCEDCGSSLLRCTPEHRVIYTKESSFNCKVYQKKCSNMECLRKYPYDGSYDCIFNMGKFLIHHGVLRDYMWHFLTGNSCTLSGFYKVWCNTQEDSGKANFKTKLSSSQWRHTWYAFLKCIDFDIFTAAECYICGKIPETIVCDATSLGYQRKFATITLQNYPSDGATVYPRFSEHKDRIAIPSKKLRDSLDLYVDGKMNIRLQQSFFEEVRFFNRSMYNVLKWANDIYINIKSTPKPILELFRCIASGSPVCSYIFPSESVQSLIDDLFNIGMKSKVQLLRSVQIKIPIIFDILTSLTIETCLPDVFKGLLLYLYDKALQPFNSALRVNTRKPDVIDRISSFPNLPEIRERGFFAQDKESFKDSCRKFYRGHPRLMPGIFTVYCQHGICYGYQVMESQESPNVPFTIFKTRFPKAPKVIIYDNACGLHAYCLNRDPLYFQESLFLVDRFHWKNHVGCSAGYNMRMYRHLKDVNSEINEQQNSATKKLKTQLSYMNKDNFLMHCNFFFWYRNDLKKKKISINISA